MTTAWLSEATRARLSRINREDVLAALTALDQREKALVQAAEFASPEQRTDINRARSHVAQCRVALHCVFIDMTKVEGTDRGNNLMAQHS